MTIVAFHLLSGEVREEAVKVLTLFAEAARRGV